ncbi:surface lipoprotein assembly modifier [Neisseria sp. S1]|uniref:surface lipoprotein assembly modifier n=1 Tax=Neisseria sp. S1 TaxID=3318354 RepID=UPI003A8B2BBA
MKLLFKGLSEVSCGRIFIFWGCLLCVGVGESMAQTLNPSDEPPDLQRKLEHSSHLLESTAVPNEYPILSSEHGVYQVSSEQILAQPRLLEQAMQSVVGRNNVAGISKILPLYMRLPGHNPALAAYAQGILLMHKKEYAEAAGYFRQAGVDSHYAEAASLYLAASMAANKQNYEARQILDDLKANASDNTIKEAVVLYANALEQRGKWQADLSASFIYDRNLNNAPDARSSGGFTFNEKIEDSGIRFQSNVARRIALPKGFYLQPYADIWGKYYKKARDFNDLNIQTAMVLGWSDWRYDLSVKPYAGKRFYGNRPYSHTVGSRFSLARRWQDYITTSVAFDHAQEKLSRKERRIYNNKNNEISFNLAGSDPDGGFGALIGVDIGRHYGTRDSEDRYQSRRMRLLWSQQLPAGFKGQLGLVKEKRKYGGGTLFTGTHHRRDHYTLLSGTLWNDKFEIAGLTPKLSWQRQKNQSNSILNTFSKQGVFVEIEKKF